MNKILNYGKRKNGQNFYNNYGNYAGYPNSYKKNYFKGRPKQNNIQMNNYFENRKNSYYYNNTFYPFNNSFSNFNENKNFNYSFVHRNRYWLNNKYNQKFVEEKKTSEETNNDSGYEEEKLEEILKLKVNISDSEYKELVLYKNDDINERVYEFCNDNNISKKLVEPLIYKVTQSLKALEIISNMSLNKSDFLILDKVKNNFDSNKDN